MEVRRDEIEVGSVGVNRALSPHFNFKTSLLQPHYSLFIILYQCCPVKIKSLEIESYKPLFPVVNLNFLKVSPNRIEWVLYYKLLLC